MKELIKKHLEGWQGLEKLSITHFEETGEISGSFFIALKEMIKEDRAEQLILSGVGNWVRFEDDKPKLNDRYLLVWDNYPPETRTWQKEDIYKDYTGLRWLAIPKWK